MHCIMFSCFVLLYIYSQVRCCVLLLVTCNPVLPVSWSSCRRLNWHPHLGDQVRWVAGYPSRIKNKTCRRADELLASQRPTQAEALPFQRRINCSLRNKSCSDGRGAKTAGVRWHRQPQSFFCMQAAQGFWSLRC